MIRSFALFLVLLVSCSLFAQKSKETVDSTDKYTLFKDRVVLYKDVGFISSPFYLRFKDTLGTKTQLAYRINHGVILGFGGSYKWFSLRLAFMAANNIENREKYGKTSYFGLHLGLPIKNTFTEFDLYSFGGYALKNASKKIPNHTTNTLLFPEMQTFHLSLASYYFFNQDFKVNPAMGRSGNYSSKVHSWYLKAGFGFNTVSNGNSTLIPEQFIESVYERSRTDRINALDLSFVPGFAYVNRYKNWQFSGIIGVGITIQDKFYAFQKKLHNFIGLSGRGDFKINLGYNPENWFVMLNNELNFVDISVFRLSYSNILYNVRLTGGYRFKTKEKKKKL